MITERRDEKFKRVAAFRQEKTVILENVHDPHNIGAVLRTCDSVGIQEVYILYTDDRLTKDNLNNFKISSTGVKKWLHIHYHEDPQECFKAVKAKYSQVLATHLEKDSQSIYDTDLTSSTAFLFGNEHEGVSEESLKYADGNILIPQFGMVQSLNISVACAITLYESSRQRIQKGLYDEHLSVSDQRRQSYYQHFLSNHK